MTMTTTMATMITSKIYIGFMKSFDAAQGITNKLQ